MEKYWGFLRHPSKEFRHKSTMPFAIQILAGFADKTPNGRGTIRKKQLRDAEVTLEAHNSLFPTSTLVAFSLEQVQV